MGARRGGWMMTACEFPEPGQDGPVEKPGKMFMAWNEVASVQQKRVGKIWEFTIVAKDGSWASYTSNSFFRSKHVARTIAERAGLTIQES